ncbi:MAG TPA: Hsp20/alpha crystallin family protein [Opitutaceae bacterium]|nr:Hsp20/alpha crystallin family protein [Opitutaceae bacterium]
MRIVRYSYPNARLGAAGRFVRSPWAGLESEIDQLVGSALAGFAGPASAQRFPVDLYEDKDNTYVRAELPGVKREDISVETVNGYLTLSASRKQGEGENQESFSFTRSVTLPDEVDTGKISASYENGILTVTLPKSEAAKPKKVTVEVK